MYSQTILNHMIGLTFVEYSMQIEQVMLVIITEQFSIFNFSEFQLLQVIQLRYRVKFALK